MQHAATFQVIEGQLIGARQIASPNYNARPAHSEIELLVVHNISLPPSQFGGAILNSFFKISWIGRCILIFKPFKACKCRPIC